MADLTIKQGDTLIADCIYKDAAGTPVDLDAAGITIKSAVRSADGRTLHPLTVTRPDQLVNPGHYRLESETGSWVPGSGLVWDIRYFLDGASFSTRTISIVLSAAVTPG